MNLRIFFSTFLLIFMAELGDKTQLAAMSRVATEGSARWTIFLAASSALVLSTLAAVLLGSAITRVVPERVIKIAAGCLFVFFGILILREAVAPEQEAVPVARKGGLTEFVFRQAAAFEQAAFEDYRALARRARRPEVQRLLVELAAEEEEHYRQLTEMRHVHSDWKLPASDAESLREQKGLAHNVADTDRPIVEHALEHEKATANFYAELARLTPIPALKSAFSSLAARERDHARRLGQLAG